MPWEPGTATGGPGTMMVPRRAPEVRSPLHDWRVAAVPRGGIAAGVRRHETPFVGREELLHQFNQVLGQAREDGRLVVCLIGESGIGKTRLLREFARRGVLLGLGVSWIDDFSPWPSQRVSVTPDPQDADSSRVTVVPAPSIQAPASSPRLVMVDLHTRLDHLPDAIASAFEGGEAPATVVYVVVSSPPQSLPLSVHAVLA